MQKNTWHRPRRHGLALAAVLCCAQAQAQTEPGHVEKAAILERTTVTGPIVRGMERGIDRETALPVEVITAEDIRRSGKASVTEILRSLTSSGPGGMTDTRSFRQFAYGASGVSLRGLSSAATLILINGRRIAPYSVPDVTSDASNFVNIDAIPRAAIERIEVLKMGASATYGSDALAGVINIILRTDYDGVEAEGQLRSAVKGGFGTQWAAVTAGRGDLLRDGWNWMATLDVHHRDEVRLADVADRLIDQRHRDNGNYYTGRPYNNRFAPTPNYYDNVSFDAQTGASNVGLRGGQASPHCPSDNRWAFNGTFNPPLDLCGYTTWNDLQLLSPTRRTSLFSRGEIAIGGGATAFGELSLTRLTNKQRDWPVPFGAGVGSTPNARDGGVSYVPDFLPEGHPNNPFPGQPAGISYLFTDVGTRAMAVANHASRLVLGARGSHKGWDWETGLTHARDQASVSYLNRVSLPVLRDAVLDGTYDFENPKAGAVTADQLRVNPVDHGRTSLTMVDAKVSGQFGRLPGGAIGVTAGVEARHEQRSYRPDERIYAGQVYLEVAGRVDGSRNVMSAFGELNLPLTRSLQAQLALRGDRYSDASSSLMPKLAVTWTPLQSLKLRGNVSQGTRATSLTESARADVPLYGYVGYDPKRCESFDIDCNGYPNSSLVKGNPGLKPERSTAYGLGFIFEPVRGFSMTLDYWDFRRRNGITFVDQQSAIDHEDSTDPLYAGRVHRQPPDSQSVPGQMIPGRIATVDQLFTNLGRTQVRGVDLTLRGRLPLPGTAPLHVGLESAYTDRLRDQMGDGQPWVVWTGALDVPRLRAKLNLDWSPGAWELGATINHLSGFSATMPGEPCVGKRFLNVCDITPYTTLDLGLAYKPNEAWTLRSLLVNVTNERMPFTPTMPLGNTYWHSPAGRMLSLSAQHKF